MAHGCLTSAPWLLLWLIGTSDSHNHHKFTAKWSSSSNGYFPLPWSLDQALDASWIHAGVDSTLNVVLASHVDDPRFFLLFDKQNTIAGVAFGFNQRDVNRVVTQENPYNYTFPDSMYRSAKYWDKDVWLSYVLFAHPEVIRTTGRASLDPTTDDVIKELHFRADHDWRLAPRVVEDVTEQLVPQGCYDGMGKHYFYKTDSRTDCSQWQGFFVTYHRGVIAAFGVAVFGSFVSNYYNFSPTYYEYPDFPLVRSILPNRPTCLDEWLPFVGVTSVHVFVTADAADISCAQSADQSADQTWYHSLLSSVSEGLSQLVPSQTSYARQDSEPSYLTTVMSSGVIIYYYFSFFS